MTQLPAASGPTDQSTRGRIHVSPEQILRLDRPVPRYTSFPTADRFSDDFSASDYKAALTQADGEGADKPFSLYVHLPFCDQMCTYCACNMVVAHQNSTLEGYLLRLFREIDAVCAHLKKRRRVTEFHFGGGTPNFYPPEALGRILNHVRGQFHFDDEASISIEVDPRLSSAQEVADLAALGFNRISYGVQDFDPDVQEAVGRIQPYAITEEVVHAARAQQIGSVNVDLIYGLPRQDEARFSATLEKVLTLRPDRLALFSFAYLPQARPNQRKIVPEEVPGPEEKVALFCRARDALLDAGYVAVGMDHFALPTDAMAEAFLAGRLHRNFQGYTVAGAEDMLGFGMSAIGELSGAYSQNPRRISGYNAAMDAGDIPTLRGITLSEEDQKRRFVIRELMCHFAIDDATYGQAHGRTLREDFPDAFTHLKQSQAEGLVEISDDAVRVTPMGELFVRIVASAFDGYLRAATGRPLPYSRAI
jgi:oxygen-independent coproporphyrinogen-3 oxidase